MGASDQQEHRIVTTVPETLYQEIEREARRKWCSISHVARETLFRRFLPEGTPPAPPRAPKARKG